MPKEASNTSIAASFSNNGYATGIPVLTKEAVAVLRNEVESIFKCFDPPRNDIRGVNLFFPWALEIVRKPEIVGPVSEILGTDVLLKGVMILIKPPHSNSVVLWHSDHIYAETGLSPQVSAWLALSPSFPENGCMQVVPGSHKHFHPHHEVQTMEHQLNKHLTVIDTPKPSTVEYLKLEPGQMSLHDPVILHASGPNETDIPRIGFIMRYVTPEFPPSQEPPIVRISGNAPCTHLNMIEPIFADRAADRIKKLIEYEPNK